MKSVLEKVSVEGSIIDENEVFLGKKQVNPTISNQKIIPLSPDKTMICTLYNIFFEKIQIEENELNQLNKDEVYIFGPSGAGKTRKLFQYGLSLNSSYLIYVCFQGVIPNPYNNKDLTAIRLLDKIDKLSSSEDVCNETEVFYLSRFIHLIKMKKKFRNLSSKQFLVSQFGEKNQRIIDRIYHQIRIAVFNGDFNKNFDVLKQYIENNDYLIAKKNVKIAFDEISTIFQHTDPKFAKPILGGYNKNEKRPLPYPFFYPSINIFGGKLFCGTIARMHWRENIVSIVGKSTKEAIGNMFIQAIATTVETIKHFVQKFVTKSINWEKVKEKKKLFCRFRLIERFVCSLLTSDYSSGPFEPFVDKIIKQVFETYKSEISTTIRKSCVKNPDVQLLLMLIQTKLRGNDYKDFKVTLSNDLDIMPAQVAYLYSNGESKVWKIKEQVSIEALKSFNFEKIGHGITIESLTNGELKYIATALEGRHTERGFDFEQFFSKLFFDNCVFKTFEQIFGDLSEFRFKGVFPNQKLMQEVLFKIPNNKNKYYIHSILYTDQTRNKINSLHQTNKIDLLTIFGKKENTSVLSMSLKTAKEKVVLNERKSAVKQSSLCYPFSDDQNQRKEYIQFINKLNLKNIVRLIIEVNGEYSSIPDMENYHFFTRNNMDDANEFKNIENIEETIIWIDENNIKRLIGEKNVFFLSFMADIKLNASNYTELGKLIQSRKKEMISLHALKEENLPYVNVHALKTTELNDNSFFSFESFRDSIFENVKEKCPNIFGDLKNNDIEMMDVKTNMSLLPNSIQSRKSIDEIIVYPVSKNFDTNKIRDFAVEECKRRRKRKREETLEEENKIRKESTGREIKQRKIDYKSWTKEKVKNWINSIDENDEWKKKNYGQLFFEKNVTGKILKIIGTEERLEIIGVNDFADQMLIITKIDEICE